MNQPDSSLSSHAVCGCMQCVGVDLLWCLFKPDVISVKRMIQQTMNICKHSSVKTWAVFNVNKKSFLRQATPVILKQDEVLLKFFTEFVESVLINTILFCHSLQFMEADDLFMNAVDYQHRKIAST